MNNKLQVPIAIQKKCGCGKDHDMVPVGAKPMLVANTVVGYLWNCECHSTLFFRTVTMEQYQVLSLQEAA